MTTMSVRRRRPGYHRAAGRTLMVAGALVAGSARPAPRRRPQPAVVGAQP